VHSPQIFTIGHSNHSSDHFLTLLKSHKIDVIVDTRTHPYSNHTPQFDEPSLKACLENSGFRYLYLGNQLGGRPADRSFYDSQGHVLYAKISYCDDFRQAISRLEKGLQRYRIALLCAEENPAHCHRRLLITRVLTSEGVSVGHIRGDNSLQSEEEFLKKVQPQVNLFDDPDWRSEWKSSPSVSRRSQLRTSSVS
jgi:uncharacterized protein (DUF488 family)